MEDASALACLHSRIYHMTYSLLLPEKLVRANAPYDWEELWRQRFPLARCTRVAEMGSETVGFVQAGLPVRSVPGCDAELYSIFVLPEYQGLGLGGLLFGQVMNCLAAQDFHRVGLWALSSNPSVAFYSAMGMQVVDRVGERHGASVVNKVAYARNPARM